jgi:hypothetical protein
MTNRVSCNGVIISAVKSIDGLTVNTLPHRLYPDWGKVGKSSKLLLRQHGTVCRILSGVRARRETSASRATIFIVRTSHTIMVRIF